MFKAISYWFFDTRMDGSRPIEQAMAEAKAAGFEGFEVCIGADGTGGLNWTDDQARCKEIAAAARAIDLKISSACTGLYWGTSLSSPRKEEREQAVEMTRKMLQQTKWLGARHLLVVPGNVGADFTAIEPVPYDAAYRNSLASLKRAVKTAEELKVFLCVENVWNKFLYSPLELKQFVKAIGSRWAGVYYDVANTVLVGYPEHWIQILGPMIKRVHVKDFDRSKPTFPAGFDVPFGAGSVNWPAVVKALQAVGYDGPLTAEYIPPHPPYDGPAGEAAIRLKADIDKALGV